MPRDSVTRAFLLGAGLGTRLRPLTDRLPKPLVPLFHRPLAGWALDALQGAGIERVAINTHHLPAAWDNFAADDPAASACPIDWFHEPVLLETGGGLKNLGAWIGDGPLLVHNGDIFSTLPLERLIAAHLASGLPATLALRSTGGERRVAIDPADPHRVADIRGLLGRSPGTHLFTGIYCVSPEVLELIPNGEVVSIVPAFAELARRGRLGALILDDGHWLDLGDRDSYLAAHRDLALGPEIHPQARIAPGATVIRSVIGPGAWIEAGARVVDSVVWPDTHLGPQADLDHCIAAGPATITGRYQGVDCFSA